MYFTLMCYFNCSHWWGIAGDIVYTGGALQQEFPLNIGENLQWFFMLLHKCIAAANREGLCLSAQYLYRIKVLCTHHLSILLIIGEQYKTVMYC